MDRTTTLGYNGKKLKGYNDVWKRTVSKIYGATS